MIEMRSKPSRSSSNLKRNGSTRSRVLVKPVKSVSLNSTRPMICTNKKPSKSLKVQELKLTLSVRRRKKSESALIARSKRLLQLKKRWIAKRSNLRKPSRS